MTLALAFLQVVRGELAFLRFGSLWRCSEAIYSSLRGSVLLSMDHLETEKSLRYNCVTPVVAYNCGV